MSMKGEGACTAFRRRSYVLQSDARCPGHFFFLHVSSSLLLGRAVDKVKWHGVTGAQGPTAQGGQSSGRASLCTCSARVSVACEIHPMDQEEGGNYQAPNYAHQHQGESDSNVFSDDDTR